MAGVTKEEIARAKELDLLTYFKLVEPGNLKLGNPLSAFRHKQDSTLVAEQTAIFSTSGFLRVNI